MTGESRPIIGFGVQTKLFRCTRQYIDYESVIYRNSSCLTVRYRAGWHSAKGEHRTLDQFVMNFGPVYWTVGYFRQIAGIDGSNMPGHRIWRSDLIFSLHTTANWPNVSCSTSQYLMIWVQCQGVPVHFGSISDVLWTILQDFGLLRSKNMGSESAMTFDLE